MASSVNLSATWSKEMVLKAAKKSSRPQQHVRRRRKRGLQMDRHAQLLDLGV
jgi:hypothetical protein